MNQDQRMSGPAEDVIADLVASLRSDIVTLTARLWVLENSKADSVGVCALERQLAVRIAALEARLTAAGL